MKTLNIIVAAAAYAIPWIYAVSQAVGELNVHVGTKGTTLGFAFWMVASVMAFVVSVALDERRKKK